jgi:DNA invertase Pin-like site-specific DNA recombinase
VEGARAVRVGYVRVSSVDQNTVRQLDGIVVERIFTDRASGKDTARPALDEMLAFVRDGDTVIVHSMDRLARPRRSSPRRAQPDRKACRSGGELCLV